MVVKMRKRIFKIPVKTVVTIVILQVIFFVIVFLVGNQKASKYVKTEIKTQIPKVYVTGNENYGALRGAVFFSRDSFISTSATLIGDIKNVDIWKSHGPIIDLDTIPHQYTLDDLALPYELSKDENCNTIIIKKDGYELKFLLIEEE